MKLQELEVFVVGNPPPGRGGRYFILLTVTTDDGVEGVGEVYCASFSPHIVAAMIEDVFERWFLGQDPHATELLFRRVYGAGYSQRPDPSLIAVFSGLEIACWDIVGKAAGQPVCKLLGGPVRDRLRAYTYLYPPDGPAERGGASGAGHVYDDPAAGAAQAAAEVAAGFTAVKFDPAGPYSVLDGRQPDRAALDRSAAFCAAIREAVGDKADLLFGTHGQFTPSGAIRLARRLEPYDPLWFEEPTPPDAPEAMARVARATSVPVATGERLTTSREFAAVLAAGAASILQPNLSRCGGIGEAKKIAAIAEVHGAEIAPHLYNGPITAAANIQLAAAIPNFLVLEAIRDFSGFHAELLETPLRVEEGYAIAPQEPGLGVTLNKAVARAHPYAGERLHLEMLSGPVEG